MAMGVALAERPPPYCEPAQLRKWEATAVEVAVAYLVIHLFICKKKENTDDRQREREKAQKQKIVYDVSNHIEGMLS